MHDIKSEKNYNADIKVWNLVVFGILFLSILRGIRFPNMWSYTHFLFDYSFGFVKRGLIGEIISQFNFSSLMSYDSFLIFSTAIFLTNIFLIGLLLREFINSKNPVFIGSSLLFCSSLAVVFLSNSIGYFDHIGLLVTLIALKLCGFYKKFIFLLISMPFVLLIHEATLIIFFPVIFMSLLFALEKEGYTVNKILMLGSFSAVVLILALFIGNQTLTEPEVRQMYDSLQANLQHPLRQDAFSVLHRDAKDNLSIMQHLWSSNRRLIDLAYSFLVTAPVFMLFIYFSASILKKMKIKYYLIVLAVLASLSPLILHFFAWDMHRWNTLAVTTSFLMLFVVYTSSSKGQPKAAPRYIYHIFVFLLFLNAISSIPLFEGYQVKQFPFALPF